MNATLVPKNKVIAATGGAAIGGAVSTILIWLIDSVMMKLGAELPDDVKAALSTLITTAVALAAGYYTPPGANEGVVVTPDGSVKSAII